MRDSEKSFRAIELLLQRFRTMGADEYLLSKMAEYACVLASAALEQAVREALHDFCELDGGKIAKKFAQSRISDFQNPNPKKIMEITSEFSPDWAIRLEEYWRDEISGHIGSIVSNRHNIVHGKPSQVTISRVSDWMKSAKRFSDYYYRQVCRH